MGVGARQIHLESVWRAGEAVRIENVGNQSRQNMTMQQMRRHLRPSICTRISTSTIAASTHAFARAPLFEHVLESLTCNIIQFPLPLLPVLKPPSPLNLVLLGLPLPLLLLPAQVRSGIISSPLHHAAHAIAHPALDVRHLVVAAVVVHLLRQRALGPLGKVGVTVGELLVDLGLLGTHVQRKGGALLNLDSTASKGSVAASGAQGRLGLELVRGLVADLAIGALDVLELELTLCDLCKDLVALFAGQWPDADHAPEAILLETVTGSSTQNTRHQEVELQSGRLERSNDTNEESHAGHQLLSRGSLSGRICDTSFATTL
jgi:hypothetical protein